MKKLIIPLCAVMCICTLSGCGLFGNGESSKSKTYDISIEYDDDTKQYQFDNVEDIKIDIRQKNGHVLNGYFTEKSGKGEERINFKGESVSTNWSKGATTTLYPYYEEIDYARTYNSSVACDEKPGKYGYNVYGSTTNAVWTIEKHLKDNFEYIYKVAYGDRNVKLELKAFAELRATGNGDTTFKLGIGEDMDNGQLVSDTFKLSSAFSEHSITANITGKTIVNNISKSIIIGAFYSSVWSDGYIKNIYWTLAFDKSYTATEDTDTDDTNNNA